MRRSLERETERQSCEIILLRKILSDEVCFTRYILMRKYIESSCCPLAVAEKKICQSMGKIKRREKCKVIYTGIGRRR